MKLLLIVISVLGFAAGAPAPVATNSIRVWDGTLMFGITKSEGSTRPKSTEIRCGD